MSQSPSSVPLRIGTRGSRLALAQADWVRDTLLGMGAGACELCIVNTSGDRIGDRPLAEFGGKGLFAKELEEALLAHRIDLAVHSMKDVPTTLPKGLTIVAAPEREDPSDVFVSDKARQLSTLAPSASIGTSSVRRAAQIARSRPDLRIISMRGNVDSRLQKLGRGEVDALLLAGAGLKRLGLASELATPLSTEVWLPALAQGALAIEMRESDPRAAFVKVALNDEPTEIVTACERAFQAALDGSCRTPIAGLAVLRGRRLIFRGEVLAPDGSSSVATAVEAELGERPIEDARRLGRESGMELRPRARQWLAT